MLKHVDPNFSRPKPAEIVKDHQKIYDVVESWVKPVSLTALGILLIVLVLAIFDSEEPLRTVNIVWWAVAVGTVGFIAFLFTRGETNKWIKRGWWVFFVIILLVSLIRMWEVGIGSDTKVETPSTQSRGLKYFWKDLFTSSSASSPANALALRTNDIPNGAMSLMVSTKEYSVVPGVPGMRTSWSPLDPKACFGVKVNDGRTQIVCVDKNSKPAMWPEDGNRTIQQETIVDGPLYSFAFVSLSGKPEKIIIARGLP